jgi:apolipoprotein N-acyltransferase
MVRNGARLIAMPNFDPPSARGTLHYLHTSLLPFRAVENGVAFVRSDPNGLSQVIAPSGRILGQSPMWRPDALVRNVSLGNGRGTLFTRLGDWLAYLCAAATVLFLLAGGLFARREAPTALREPDVVSASMEEEPLAVG